MLRVMYQFGRPTSTFALTSTDAAQSLSALLLTDGGRALCAMMITVVTNDVKIALGGATPVTGAGNLGHVLKKDQTPQYIVGETACSTFKYCSATSGDAGILEITPFYAG